MVPFHNVRYGFLFVTRAVFQMFDFKKCRDLEMQVRGYSRSSKVVPFDALGTVSCY